MASTLLDKIWDAHQVRGGQFIDVGIVDVK